MPSTTKRQHYVPRFYLDQWSNEAGHVWVHDLACAKNFACDPKNALLQNYFYEDDPSNPDNVFEAHLAAMEGKAAAAIKTVVENAVKMTLGNENLQARGLLSSSIDRHAMASVIEFVAYQYFRVPGAVDQKRFEISIAPGSEEDKERALRPGRMTIEGCNYAIERFLSMKKMLIVSKDQSYITSDWPCFDLKDSINSPSLGEDIGKDPKVFLSCPIHPQVGLLMYSPEFEKDAHLAPEVSVRSMSNAEVRNQNALIIQQAERFVVSSREEQFVATVAKKRKKGYGPSVPAC